MDELVVGQTYTLGQIGAMSGGAAIVPSDRIVTGDLAWERMTVARLIEWLQTALENKEITPDAQVWLDSDPEGNGLHPMRAAASLAAVNAEGNFDEDAEEVVLPAAAVWFGVGY